jgi:chemotaxis regulatin CheY-phosphate phosphatase CheZ
MVIASEGPPAAGLPLPMPTPTAAKGAPEDEEYYRSLSSDMYNEVGRLARRLSMSIRDVAVEKIDSIDLGSAGDQLESVKDELENVVKMTEQATLKIMDLTEVIQEKVDQSQALMKQILSGEPAAENQDSSAPPDWSGLKEFLSGLQANPVASCLSKAHELLAAAQQTSPAPAPAAPAPTGSRYEFSLELVFQTMYELCTNEAVKKHIKAMWDTAGQTFDGVKLENGLNSVAAAGGGPDDDNFLNLDLKEVLKTMFQATSKDNFQQILKKMASTADQIFLEQTLPLEAIPKAGEPAPPPAPAAPSSAEAGPLAALAQQLVQELEGLAANLLPPPLPALGPAPAASGGLGPDPELLHQLGSAVSDIFSQVNGIVEALSFQDLSGQIIYKTVKLLTEFQVQLLAMVVSFGSKIKTKAQTPEVRSTAQTEKAAQEEVDKALAAVGAKEGDGEGKLNQASVNDLLGSLGF